jgi:GNAT superfamily N-acetyltransferase
MTLNAMMRIRQAEIEDASSIASVHVQSWKTTYLGIVPDSYLASLSVESRAQNWREQLITGVATILVVEDEVGIFGFVCGGKLRDQIDEFDAELYAIYLLQEKQKHGVGRELTRQLASILYDKGFRSLIVWVLEKNPAVEFYRHLAGAHVATKQIEIGGVQLTEVAFGWRSFSALL